MPWTGRCKYESIADTIVLLFSLHDWSPSETVRVTHRPRSDRMYQGNKSWAKRRLQMLRFDHHPPGEAAFSSTLPEDINWRQFPALPDRAGGQLWSGRPTRSTRAAQRVLSAPKGLERKGFQSEVEGLNQQCVHLCQSAIFPIKGGKDKT